MVKTFIGYEDIGSVAQYAGNLEEAITAINDGYEHSLVIDQDTFVTSNVTVPSNITLKFSPGNVIFVDPANTLAVNGPIEAGDHQIFVENIDDITINPNHNKLVNVLWFGAVGDDSTDNSAVFNALGAMNNGITIYVPTGTFRFGSALTFDGVNVQGVTRESTQLVYTGTSGTAVTWLSRQEPSYVGSNFFRDVQIECLNYSGNSVNGMLVYNLQNCRMDNIYLKKFTNIGMQMGHTTSGIVYNSTFTNINISAPSNAEGGSQSNSVGLFIHNDDDTGNVWCNANWIYDLRIGGAWKTHLKCEGEGNTIEGGDFGTDTGSVTIFDIRGVGNRIRDIWLEPLGGSILATYFAKFIMKDTGTTPPIRNKINVMNSGISGFYNWDNAILDQGICNEVIVDNRSVTTPPTRVERSGVNLVHNSSFTQWYIDDAYGYTPKDWLVYPPDSTTWVRETSVLKGGHITAHLDMNSVDGGHAIYHLLGGPFAAESVQLPASAFSGKNISVSIWAKTSLNYYPNGIKLEIFGTGGTFNGGAVPSYINYGSSRFHSGSGEWEMLTATARLADNVQKVYFKIGYYNYSGGSEIFYDVYLAEPAAYLGTEIPLPSPTPITDAGGKLYNPLTLATYTTAQLPDTEIGFSRGAVACDDDGYHLAIWDGDSWVHPSVHNYGEMYISSSSATSTSQTPTYTKVAGTYADGYLSGFTHSSGTLTYTGADTKYFELSAQISGVASLTDVFYYRVAVNGTTIPKSEARRRISGTANEIGSITMCCILELTQGDDVEIYVTRASAPSSNMTAEKMVVVLRSL